MSSYLNGSRANQLGSCIKEQFGQRPCGTVSSWNQPRTTGHPGMSSWRNPIAGHHRIIQIIAPDSLQKGKTILMGTRCSPECVILSETFVPYTNDIGIRGQVGNILDGAMFL